jgi:hypothetical protein
MIYMMRVMMKIIMIRRRRNYLFPRMLWSSMMRAASWEEKLPRFKSGLR